MSDPQILIIDMLPEQWEHYQQYQYHLRPTEANPTAGITVFDTNTVNQLHDFTFLGAQLTLMSGTIYKHTMLKTVAKRCGTNMFELYERYPKYFDNTERTIHDLEVLRVTTISATSYEQATHTINTWYNTHNTTGL